MKNIEYKVIWGIECVRKIDLKENPLFSREHFEKRVNDHIALGWVPQGGVSTHPQISEQVAGYRLYQAMIREKEDE